jgi:hypothetical protein
MTLQDGRRGPEDYFVRKDLFGSVLGCGLAIIYLPFLQHYLGGKDDGNVREGRGVVEA